MYELQDRTSLIRNLCEREDLRTFDPYDIWKTPLGFRAKNFYNHHRMLGLPVAAMLTIFDVYINSRKRLFYTPQEYPIVRAMAAQALLKLYSKQADKSLLPSVRSHLNWLSHNTCRGYSGPCWGLGFKYAVGKGLVYDANTPLTTMTPYALEAFVMYTQLTGDESWLTTIRDIFQFFEHDVQVLEETDDYLVTSYSTLHDRKVINAVSYVMYSYSLLYPYVDTCWRETVARKIRKLYNYIVHSQADDGSWPYSAEPPSFIDCFHSCIVIKNLIKTSSLIQLDCCSEVVSRGYGFLKERMLVKNKGLFKRFAKSDKPGIIRFDLYDNAEMLNLAHLMGDKELMQSIDTSITETFVRGKRIYSQVDWLGLRQMPGMLRWAIMPYLYALAAIQSGATEQPRSVAPTSVCSRCIP